MPAPNSDHEGLGQGTRYLAMGLRFAGGVVLFLLGGLALDRWLHLTPIGTIVGTLLGVTLSTLSVYREVMADLRKGPPPA